MTGSRVADIVAQVAAHDLGDAAVGPDDDLWQAGMSSLTAISVIMALEDELDIEFPEHLLSRSHLATVRAIEVLIDRVLDGDGAR